MKPIWLSLAVVFALGSALAADHQPPGASVHATANQGAAVERITFHGEWFPLYGKGGTPIAKGNLADAKVEPADDVAIPAGASVTLDGRFACRHLYVAGKLELKPGFQLQAVTILVDASGTLTGGDQGEIVIRDQAIDLKLDPFQTGHGLVVWGRVDLRGQAKTPWLEAANGLAAGDQTIQFAARPEGWAVGDELVITDTRQHPNTGDGERTVYGVEYVRIAAIDGNTVTIEPALQHDRPEYSHQRTGKRLRPHVGNLTRSVTVRSENPQATRGHTIMLGRAEGDFRHVAFAGMGRTTSERLDSAFVADLEQGGGQAKHVGKNQIGRYALHYHHAGGLTTMHGDMHGGKPTHGHPAARKLTAGRKERFVVEGCSFQDNRKWGPTIHGTSDGVATNNVVAGAQGAGIMTEDGTERNNLIEGNLICDIGSERGHSTRGGVNRFNDQFGRQIIETGFEGTGLWLRAGGNIVRNNVVANCAFAAMMMNGYYERATSDAGISPVAIKELSDNLGYSCNTGLYMAHYQTGRNASVPHSVVGPHTFWHISMHGVNPYHSPQLHFEQLVLIADPAVSRQNRGGGGPGRASRVNVGLQLGNASYTVAGLIVDRAEVYGFNVGISSPQNTVHDPAFGAVIRQAVLQNHVNVWHNFNKQAQHRMEISSATFVPGADAEPRDLPDSVSGLGELDVAMAPDWPPSKRANPVRQETQLIVNGQRYYYVQQAPDFVIGEHRLLAADDEKLVGLTVREAFERHGRTIGGGVAPNTARQPRVLGFVGGR